METMAFYRGTYFSHSVGMDREVNILLPHDIGENERLKTLYLLHGYYGNHQQWIRYTSIERYAAKHRLMIVMPEAQNGFYFNHAYGAAHFDALMDVMHHVERIFPVSKAREDRFVCGLSMGGYGALKWALTHPELFSKAASLSGALDLVTLKKVFQEESPNLAYGLFGDEDLEVSNNNLLSLLDGLLDAQATLPSVYLACGTEDYLYHENLMFKEALEVRKVKHTYKASKGEHTWAYWDEAIQPVLDWIFNV